MLLVSMVYQHSMDSLFLQKRTLANPGHVEDFTQQQTKQLDLLIQRANEKKEEAKKLNLSPKVERERPLLIQSLEVSKLNLY